MAWWKYLLFVPLALVVWVMAPSTQGPDTRPTYFGDVQESLWPYEMQLTSAGAVPSRAWIGIESNGIASSGRSGRCVIWYWEIDLWGSQPWKAAHIFDRGTLIHTQSEMRAGFRACRAGSDLWDHRGGRRASLYLVAPQAEQLRIVVEDIVGNIFQYDQDLSALEAEKQATLRYLRGEH